ncbi:MAG: GspE/PulE family protein [Patescibacteria group bacterium UBA2103]
MKGAPQYSLEEAQSIFVNGGYVSPENFALVEKEADVVGALVRKNILTPDLVGQAIAEHAAVNYADINSNGVAHGWHEKISEEDARVYRFVIFSVAPKKRHVIAATDTLKNRTEIVTSVKKGYPGHTIEVAYGLTSDIDNAFKVYQKPLQSRLKEILSQESKRVSTSLDEILKEALDRNVSDIHFEPRKEKVSIRFRIDGVLSIVGEVSDEYYKSMVNRIKILAGLRIDEHTKTQDGSIRTADAAGDPVDLRVSVAPTISGEKVVIRVLSKYTERSYLEDLGFTEKQAAVIMAAAENPLGFIVVSGPTGSGKTTTLHTLLSAIASPEINITTIEDPVEYRLKDANQIQVNEAQGITFAKGLRSIVRQDPDVILVGEVRDIETAEISINAALTGHRVFTTFHASSASITIPRLLDMGVEEFLLSSTLSVVVGQRLVRKLCSECRFSYQVPLKDIPIEKPNRFFFAKQTLYDAKGCAACGGTGYRGRIAVAEVLQVSDGLRNLILQKADAGALESQAIQDGMDTMFISGIEKVKRGETSLAELLRVVTPPDA